MLILWRQSSESGDHDKTKQNNKNNKKTNKQTNHNTPDQTHTPKKPQISYSVWILFRVLLHKDSIVSPVTQVICLHKNLFYKLKQSSHSQNLTSVCYWTFTGYTSMENLIVQRKREFLPSTIVFSFVRGLLLILLSVEGWNGLIIHGFCTNFYIPTKPILFLDTVFIVHTLHGYLWQGNQQLVQLVPRQKGQVWLWPFLDYRAKSRDAVEEKLLHAPRVSQIIATVSSLRPQHNELLGNRTTASNSQARSATDRQQINSMSSYCTLNITLFLSCTTTWMGPQRIDGH